MTGSLDGRVAIVTGASRGIGAEIARRFAAEGARVAVSARTTEAGQSAFEGTIHETVQSIVDAGGTAVAVAANLARPEDRARLVAETERQLGPVDVLVNNGAVTWFGAVETFQEKHFRMMFEVQVRAPFELAQLVLPGMRARRWGAILNISSKGAIHPAGPPFGDRPRRHRLRHGEGGAGAVHDRARRRGPRRQRARQRAVTDVDRADARRRRTTSLLTPEREHLAEPVDVMASAALALVTDPPGAHRPHRLQPAAAVGARPRPASRSTSSSSRTTRASGGPLVEE